MQDDLEDLSGEPLMAAVDRDALTRFIVRRTGDWALAEDVVQDTLLKLMEFSKRTQVRDPSALAFRIAENLMRDHFRRPHSRTHDLLDEELRDDAPGAETLVMDKQRLALVNGIVAQMPKKRREVLVRRRVHGESLSLIAKAMDLSPQAVEKHLVRALAQLRDGMETALEQEARV